MGNSGFCSYYCVEDQIVEDKRDPGRSRTSAILMDEYKDKEIWCYKCKVPRLIGNPPSFQYKYCPKCGDKLLTKEDFDRRERRPQKYDLDPAPLPTGDDDNNVQMINGDPVMPLLSDSEVSASCNDEMNRVDTFSDDDDPFDADNGGGAFPQTVSKDSVTQMRYMIQQMKKQEEDAAVRKSASFPKKDPASQK